MRESGNFSRAARPARMGAVAVAVILGLGWGGVGDVRADVVHLRNGNTIEGRVRFDEKTRMYTVETGTGTVRLRQEEVLRVEPREAPQDAFEKRWAQADKDDVEALEDLAAWARAKGLRKPLERVAKRILELDPNHEMARKVLGYVVFENEWVLERELRKREGLVRYKGEWMTIAERDRRRLDEMRATVRDLMRRAASDNPYLRRYAVRELLAYKDPALRSVFAEFLDDENGLVRSLAALLLASLPPPESGKVEPNLVRRLYDAYLKAPDAKEAESHLLALRRLDPESGFRMGLEALTSERDPQTLKRAAELVRKVLRKKWVPELCRALVTRKDGRTVRNEAVFELLASELKAPARELGYDPEAWLAWWRENEHRFRDVP